MGSPGSQTLHRHHKDAPPTSSSPRHGIWLMQHLANAKGKGSHLGGTAAPKEFHEPRHWLVTSLFFPCRAARGPALLTKAHLCSWFCPPLPPKLTGQQQIRALRSSETVPQFGLLEKRYLPQDDVPHYGQARECSPPCKLARTVAQFILGVASKRCVHTVPQKAATPWSTQGVFRGLEIDLHGRSIYIFGVRYMPQETRSYSSKSPSV